MGNPVFQKSTVTNSFEKSFQGFIKRGMDIVISLILLIVMAPLLLLISFAIYMEDRGPVLFIQSRSGKGDVPFNMYKFRSMNSVKDHRPYRKTYNWTNGVPEDFVFKSCSELHPDVTVVGRFIRKYSLDELPQLINVLKGEMSLVGPRPEVTEITDCYDFYQKKRLEVKPGITGWAQVNGRSEINHGKKIDLDNHYVENVSLRMDLKIIVRTFWQVINGKGAV